MELIVDESDIQSKRIGSSGSVTSIVYATGNDHQFLFEKFIRPLLAPLSEKYRERISFTFMGISPQLNETEYSFPIRYVKWLPTEQYRGFMKEQCFDIGLAPLENDSFSKCKYFNKFVEYSMSGTVGIYSNTEPYTDVIQDGVNGFLADNTKESCRFVNDVLHIRKRKEYLLR